MSGEFMNESPGVVPMLDRRCTPLHSSPIQYGSQTFPNHCEDRMEGCGMGQASPVALRHVYQCSAVTGCVIHQGFAGLCTGYRPDTN